MTDPRAAAQSGRPAPRPRAFTLVEAIVVIVILGILATVIAPRLIGRIGAGKQGAAQSNAASLASQMTILIHDLGRMPPAGSTITILWERPSDIDAGSWHGPYVQNKDALIDPWGKPYILRIPGQRNVDFDIVSYGADGKPGGEDEDADIVKP